MSERDATGRPYFAKMAAEIETRTLKVMTQCNAFGPTPRMVKTLLDDNKALISALRESESNRSSAFNAGLKMAAKACKTQQKAFTSPQYAAGQPASSFGERFACGACIQAISALKEPGHD